MTTKIQIRNFIALLASVGLLSILSVCVEAAPGDLDLAFGIGGKVTTQTGYNDKVSAVALQSDGKIIVAGDYGLARYNSNGSLEQTFGYIAEKYTGVAVQPDGKIVTVGNYFNVLGCPTNQVFVRRFNPDGTLDTSFGINAGFTVYFAGCYVDAYAYALVLSSDGKIVVAGAVESGTQYDFLALRLTSGGMFDTTFNLDGIGRFPIGSYNDGAYAVAIQPTTGKIVLAGYSLGSFALVMLTSSGLYDWNFGNFGKLTTSFAVSSASARAVAFQADGKIITAGLVSTPTPTGVDFALVRYNRNGSLDTSFDGDGKVTTVFGGIYSDVAYGISLQADGKIVAAGYGRSTTDTSDNFALARYNSNGSLDTSFSGDGKQTTDFGGYNDYGQAVAIQPDGKIVVAGYANNGSENDIALARYLP